MQHSCMVLPRYNKRLGAGCSALPRHAHQHALLYAQLSGLHQSRASRPCLGSIMGPPVLLGTVPRKENAGSGILQCSSPASLLLLVSGLPVD